MSDMDSERFAQVEALYAAASQLQGDEREAYLDTACNSDPELRDYLAGLLDVNPAIGAAIERTVVDTMNVALASVSDEDSLQGEMIGPYRVERLLGSGGMGMVYLAARDDDQFDQQVAIKLGRHRLVDPHTKLRLQSERQILANLDHPNIARLYDGGTTAEGVPYLVMEYIDGVRIDTYCDQRRLAIEERLELFRSICAAVHYAHQNLIIHRDIKASNILVTDDGTPKLLDFGIAKLTDTQAGNELTREGAVVLTPEAASPEQLLGRSVTTATDIYALGQLLYRMLVGVRALDIDNTSPAQLADIVCRQDIVAPSQRLADLREDARRHGGEPESLLSRVADDRGIGLDRLQRRLRDDLDTIVLKAVRREPERRYESASALAEDIALHLSGMPIVARADSWRYRSAKFLRRHAVAVGAAVMVVGMLAAFTVALSIQNQQTLRERDRARDVSQFLEDIFMTPDPANARGANVTAREILAEGAARIRSDLADNTETQSALMGTIGRVYFNLGEYQQSRELLEQALAFHEETGDLAAIAAAKRDLAATLFRVADYDGAERLLREALDKTHSLDTDDTTPTARNLALLADIQVARGEIDAAERNARESIEHFETAATAQRIELAEAKSLLARVLQIRGDLNTTETLLLEAIAIVEESEGPDHPLMAYYLQNLGVLYRSQGNLEAAETTLGQAIEAAARILGPAHDLTVATQFDQGTLLHSRDDLAAAETIMRAALRVHVDSHGIEHPRAGYYMILLGMVLHDAGKLPDAENFLRRALGIFDRTLDPQHQYRGSALTELGAVLNSAGLPIEGETRLREALSIREQDYASGHVLVAATRTELADAMTRQGRFSAAEPLLRQSVADLSGTEGRRKQRLMGALQRFADGTGEPL